MCIHLVLCSANVHEIRSIFIHTELGEDVSSQVVRSSVTSRAADKWRQTWGRVSVPALDDGLFHTRGLLWGRRTRWFLAHHWQELQQQFGALGLPCTRFTAAVHTQHNDTHNQHLINKQKPRKQPDLLWHFPISLCLLCVIDIEVRSVQSVLRNLIMDTTWGKDSVTGNKTRRLRSHLIR